MTTVFVSGASRGIGLALARAYASAGHTVFGNGRSPAPDDAVHGLCYLAVPNAGLSNDRLRAAGIERIDTLILNAAVFGPTGRPRAEDVDVDVLARVIRDNALVQISVLQAARPLLKRSDQPRVAMLVSKGGLLRTMKGPGSIYYRTSKAAQFAVGLNLYPSLAAEGIVFRLINPGSVRTRIGGKGARMSPEESAAAIRGMIDRASAGDEGFVLDFDGTPLRP